jgi:hypothetical protein
MQRQITINKQVISKILALLLGVLIVSYSLTLLSLTGNAITLKKLSLQMKRTDTEIAKTEREFSNTVTTLNASSLQTFGFTSVNSSSFAIKKDDIATFSVLYERK